MLAAVAIFRLQSRLVSNIQAPIKLDLMLNSKMRKNLYSFAEIVNLVSWTDIRLEAVDAGVSVCIGQKISSRRCVSPFFFGLGFL